MNILITPDISDFHNLVKKWLRQQCTMLEEALKNGDLNVSWTYGSERSYWKKHPSISIDLWNDWGVGQKKGMLRTDLALIDYPHEMLLLYYVGCFRFFTQVWKRRKLMTDRDGINLPRYWSPSYDAAAMLIIRYEMMIWWYIIYHVSYFFLNHCLQSFKK